MSPSKRSALVSIVVLGLLPFHVIAESTITNHSFEYGWSAWVDNDPNKDATAISGHAFKGAKSAKITRSTGRFNQIISVYPNSEYTLHAHVKGPGIVGVDIAGTEQTATSEGDGENWIELLLPFSTGSESSIQIFGAFNGAEARFDEFSLEAISGEALTAAEEAAKGPKVYATIPGSCDRMNQLAIRVAEDDETNDGHTPSMAIDANFDAESRWSSKGAGKELLLDMRFPQTLKEFGIAWYKGNERRSFYELSTSVDGNKFVALLDRNTSSGISTAIERIDFDDRVARFVRVTGFGNEKNEWTSIVEVQAYGCGLGEIKTQGDGSATAKVAGVSTYGLGTDKAPSENFDLSRWKITLPVDLDTDGRADEIEESLLANGWSNNDYFYTDPVTGGMVFRTIGGNATTPRSRYPRSELREMLRAGDTTIATRHEDGTPSKNNWVFSSAPAEAQAAAGAVDGQMHAKLSINQVTRVGDSSRVGRVIIGQIHAKDGEPLRLYYRKLPTNKYGSIYYIHELEGKDDIVVPIIGGKSDTQENPENGIALDEVFEYKIVVSGAQSNGHVKPLLDVSITRDDGTVISAPTLDMSDSNYSLADEFMYFKAGAYSQNDNKAWSDRDFDQVTFLTLEVTH